MNTETYLARPVLLPDADSFADVLEYHGEFEYGTKYPVGALLGGNEISRFCSTNLIQTGGPAHRSILVTPTDAVLKAVAPRIVTPDDRLSWRIISHKGSGKALVILEHGYIIGSHWLAYIDPSTIPSAS